MNISPFKSDSIHYGWHIVWASLLGIFASLGLGRFALGMLLPAMRESLNLSYSQMGLIGTLNFIGYLISVLACGPLTEKYGYRKVISTALFCIALSMVLISRTNSLWTLYGLYCITGMGGGAANVSIMALVSSWFSPRKRGMGTGFVVIGSGFAILMSGKLIPYVNATIGSEGWRVNWLILSGMVFLVSLISYIILRNSPQSMSLLPYGTIDTDPTLDTSPTINQHNITKNNIVQMGGIYFLFGYTYVIYATFIVTSLIQDRGFSESTAGNFWSWVGLLSLISGPVFGGLSDKIGRKYSLMIVFTIQATAYLLAALQLPNQFMYISIGCYGIVAWSVPSIMAALVGDYAGPEKAARIFGVITFIFAIGQIIGPTVAGYLAEQTNSFHNSFYMAFGFAILAVIFSATLKTSRECSNK